MKKRIAILGSTGSIGTSALAVAEAHADRIEIVGLAAGGNAPVFARQVSQFEPQVIAMASETALDEVLETSGRRPVETYGVGSEGLIRVATHPSVDLVLCATSGTAALEAVLAAIDAGKNIALANKEVLVMAGGLVMDRARARGVAILPVDSEHNAIHQCLVGRKQSDVRRLILTASGGPFRGRRHATLDAVTADDALRHPTWRMGPKITIDSATLMNKGLEVIEAHWLFGVPASRISVLVHPQSIVHSVVEFHDGSMIAQMGATDMRLPIQYAFSYPERWESQVPFLDLARCGPLEFSEPAWDDFPCLRLAYRAIEAERSFPIVLNAANEIAVAAFLANQIGFTEISHVIQGAMDAHEPGSVSTLETIRDVDAWARAYAHRLVAALQTGRMDVKG